MKLIENLYIYKGQYGYSTLLKNNEDKLYIQVSFKKGEEPTEEKLQIDIKNGFLSFYKDKNGLAKIKIVVLEYEKLGVSETTTEYTDTFGDDLPF
jgi:hypothetical protein